MHRWGLDTEGLRGHVQHKYPVGLRKCKVPVGLDSREYGGVMDKPWGSLGGVSKAALSFCALLG